MSMRGDELTVYSPSLRKTLFGLKKMLTAPRASLAWIVKGSLARDNVFVRHVYWSSGTLPRVALADILPASRDLEVSIPRAFDRSFGTSVTVEEACHLAAVARLTKGGSALEIGTFDGNTTLLLAANLAGQGKIVTLDLPPDFEAGMQDTLAHSDVHLNLTPRDRLGRQFRDHTLASRITQVFGDSAEVDWTTLGGPFDLVFIDGCHSEIYVRSDTLNALKVLAPGGMILWHDYGMLPEVSRAVDRIAAEESRLHVHALEGTRLAIGLT